MENLWLVFGLLSAITAALVAVFGKIGLQSVDANAATAIRSIIMAAFLISIVVFQGTLKEIPAIIADKKAITYIALSGVAGALSWLFYFLASSSARYPRLRPLTS